MRMFETHFALSTCKVLLEDWIGLKPTVVLGGWELSEVDIFSYLGSCISSGGSKSEEVSLRM